MRRSGLAALFASVRQGEFQPTMLRQPDGKPADFSWRPIGQYGAARQQVAYETCWKLLDDFYGERDRRELMQQKSQALRKTVSNLHSRVIRKLALQEKELAASTDRERTRQLGDIVTANLWQMQRGQVPADGDGFLRPGDAPDRHPPFAEALAAAKRPSSIRTMPRRRQPSGS